jgi:hypothetical protein
MQLRLDVDQTASAGNGVSFSVGLGFGKTGRIGELTVQLWIATDYYAVRPDDLSGPCWGIDLQIIPVISAHLRGRRLQQRHYLTMIFPCMRDWGAPMASRSLPGPEKSQISYWYSPGLSGHGSSRSSMPPPMVTGIDW